MEGVKLSTLHRNDMKFIVNFTLIAPQKSTPLFSILWIKNQNFILLGEKKEKKERRIGKGRVSEWGRNRVLQTEGVVPKNRHPNS